MKVSSAVSSATFNNELYPSILISSPPCMKSNLLYGVLKVKKSLGSLKSEIGMMLLSGSFFKKYQLDEAMFSK